MSILRFKSRLNPYWKENGILVYTTNKDSKIFPLAENDLVLVPLQFSIIETGPFVYTEEINEATWIAELLPDGEFIEETGTFITKVTKVRNNSIHQVRYDVGKDNLLVAHVTVEDEPLFPFDISEKVTMQMRVTDIQSLPYLDEFTAILIPAGGVVDDVIVCEVEPVK